jgi:hypothetical protein
MRVELTGIKIEGEFVWELHDYELGRLILALPSLIPADAVVYLEGCCVAEDVRQFLRAHPAPVNTKVYPGTVAPVPETFHIPATPELMFALAQIAEHHNSNEICDHFHVYRGNTLLVQGYDFMSLPLMLSQGFSEQEVADFCQKIGARIERRRI